MPVPEVMSNGRSEPASTAPKASIAPVYLANFAEPREIVNEGRVDHAVRQLRALAQAFEVVNIAAMHLGSRGRKRLGAGLRAGEAQHLMARVNKFWNDGGTDKAGSSGHKDSIFFSPSGPFESRVHTPK